MIFEALEDLVPLHFQIVHYDFDIKGIPVFLGALDAVESLLDEMRGPWTRQ